MLVILLDFFPFMYRLSFHPFPNKPLFLGVCSTSLLKTLWVKEKLLITSNFSFSHSVFYPLKEFYSNFIKLKIVVCKIFQFGRVQNLPFGKGLTFSQTSPGFYMSAIQVLKTLGEKSKSILTHCRKTKYQTDPD